MGNYGVILRNFYEVISQKFVLITHISETSISQNYAIISRRF